LVAFWILKGAPKLVIRIRGRQKDEEQGEAGKP
jgi:hypothetical protein